METAADFCSVSWLKIRLWGKLCGSMFQIISFQWKFLIILRVSVAGIDESREISSHV